MEQISLLITESDYLKLARKFRVCEYSSLDHVFTSTIGRVIKGPMLVLLRYRSSARSEKNVGHFMYLINTATIQRVELQKVFLPDGERSLVQILGTLPKDII